MIYTCIFNLNPYAAELFRTIFHLFETGIAIANSSFKCQKICLFIKNVHPQNLTIWFTELKLYC